MHTLADIEKKIQKKYSESQNVTYQCQRCGMCCYKLYNVVIIPDLERLKRENPELLKHVRIRPNHNNTSLVLYFPKNPDSSCIFLKDKNVCTIHKFRPLVCRLFPTEVNNTCPGLHKGSEKLFTEEKFKKEMHFWREYFRLEVYLRNKNKFEQILALYFEDEEQKKNLRTLRNSMLPTALFNIRSLFP